MGWLASFIECPECRRVGSVAPSQTADGSSHVCTQCGARGHIEQGTTDVRMHGSGEVRSGSVARFVVAPRAGDQEGDWWTIIRDHGIGDLIFTTPLADHLRRSGCRVAYRCPEWGLPLIRHVCDSWQPLRSPEPTVGRVVDLRGVADDGRPLDDMNRVEAYASVAGVRLKDAAFRVEPTEANRLKAEAIRTVQGGGLIAALCPVSAHGSRTLEDDEAIERELRAVGFGVLRVGRASVEPTGDTPGLVVRRSSVEDLIATLLAADVTVSADSGPLYVASGLGKPVVGVFRTVNPALRLCHQSAWAAFGPGTGTPSRIAEAAAQVMTNSEARGVLD